MRPKAAGRFHPNRCTAHESLLNVSVSRWQCVKWYVLKDGAQWIWAVVPTRREGWHSALST